jgi:hypothetical protein
MTGNGKCAFSQGSDIKKHLILSENNKQELGAGKYCDTLMIKTIIFILTD